MEKGGGEQVVVGGEVELGEERKCSFFVDGNETRNVLTNKNFKFVYERGVKFEFRKEVFIDVCWV